MEESKRNSFQKLKIFYLIILINLLIFTFVISFKTGESMYYLVNTNPENKSKDVTSTSADWSFEVRIEY